MHKQLLLFPEQRAANFAAALTILEPIVIPLAWKAHKDALDEFGDRRLSDESFRILLPGEAAQFVHRQVVHRLSRLLSDHGLGIPHRWIRIHGMDVLCVDDQVYLCFKKLRRGLKRSNYKTAHNEAFWRQSDSGRPLKLIYGYRPNRFWNDARSYLTLPSGRRVVEWVDVLDQTEQLIQLVSTGRAAPAISQEKRKRFIARPKANTGRKRKAEGEDGG